jgi:hypothetical protein
VDDPGAGVVCRLDSGSHFDSASVVKVTILDAAGMTHTGLGPGAAWGPAADGWLPLAPHQWRINSLGGFTGHGERYSVVVLSQDNPTMAYGVATVERIAEAVNRDLNPGAVARVPATVLSRAQQAPDETLP